MSPLKNGLWLLSYQLLRMLAGVWVTAAVARSLGPLRFGDYHSVVAMALLLSMGASLGLMSVVINAAAVHPEPARVLATALRLRLGAGILLLLAGVWGLPHWAPASWHQGWAIALLPLLAQSLDVVEYGFTNLQQSRTVALVHIGALLAGTACNLVGVLQGAGLQWFFFSFALEYLLVALAYGLLYRRSANGPWIYDKGLAASLLSQSWPILLSSISYLFYMRIDTVMVQRLAPEGEAGLYAASARLAQLGLFFPPLLINVVASRLAQSFRDDSSLFKRQTMALYSLLSSAGLGIALFCALLSPWLVDALYGEAFAKAAPLLTLHAFLSWLLFVRAGLDRTLVVRKRPRDCMGAQLSIALLNVALNFGLIPCFGALGAVYASLGAVALGGFLLPTLFPGGRTALQEAWLGFAGPLLWLKPEYRAVLISWARR